MITSYSIPKLDKAVQCCVTIGSFDGLHKGHMSILNQLVDVAKQKKLKSLVFTFDPHPRSVLSEDHQIQLLSSTDEKIKALEAIGIDYLVIYPFDKAFSRLSADDFVKNILVEGLHTKNIIIGYDHRFGRNRTADIDDLIAFGKEFDFEVQQLKAKQIDYISISSTKIRKALKTGDITTANSYLGYNYTISGRVINGNQLGRTIGFPTANIQLDQAEKLIPYKGVYIAKSSIEGKEFYGMMNIGTKPTVSGVDESIEIHFFELDQNLYHSNLSLEILHRLRDEQKFDSVTELEAQLREDQAKSLKWIQQKKK